MAIPDEALSGEPTSVPAAGAHRLPPRPDLSGAWMSIGFMVFPTRFLDQCHERCGDYFTLRPAADRELVVTADPAAIKQVFTGDPTLLYAGEANIVLAPILGSASTLLLDGAEHMRHRKILLPPFHGERMRAYGDVMREVAERKVASWPRGKTFASLPEMQAITLEIIVRGVFGVSDPEQRTRLAEPLRRMLDMLASRPRVIAMGLTAGRFGPLSPWRTLVNAREEADALIYEEIKARRVSHAEGEGADILSLLLDARDEDGEPMSDKELRDELVTLLVAGHETTATALAWTLERLGRSPRELARLSAEVRSGDDEYLEAVIKESLRLRPVVPAVARRLKAPMTFGPWDLPAGVHIAPSIYLLHRRPDIYPEPLAFRPERFLGEDRPGTYEWIPFGGGVRRCLGASFALFEMKTVLRTLLENAAIATTRRPAEGVTRRAITFAPTRGGRVALAR